MFNFSTLISMILNIIISVKFSWKVITVMLHILKDVGKTSTPLWIGLRLDGKLQTKRTTRVPIQYSDKLNIISNGLQENGIRKQSGSTHHEKTNSGTTFLNALILMKKNDSIKTV